MALEHHQDLIRLEWNDGEFEPEEAYDQLRNIAFGFKVDYCNIYLQEDSKIELDSTREEDRVVSEVAYVETSIGEYPYLKRALEETDDFGYEIDDIAESNPQGLLTK
jgi:hypothetical protein